MAYYPSSLYFLCFLLLFVPYSCGQWHYPRIEPKAELQWGDWGPAQICPNDAHVYAFALKVEVDQGDGDDTTLNGIKLYCRNGHEVTSKVGPWGSWGSKKQCPQGRVFDGAELVSRPEIPPIEEHLRLDHFFRFATSGQNGVGPRRSDSNIPVLLRLRKNLDNTGANNLFMICQGNIALDGEGSPNGIRSGHSVCPPGKAICGLQTKVQGKRGTCCDDTALNMVRFFCC